MINDGFLMFSHFLFSSRCQKWLLFILARPIAPRFKKLFFVVMTSLQLSAQAQKRQRGKKESGRRSKEKQGPHGGRNKALIWRRNKEKQGPHGGKKQRGERPSLGVGTRGNKALIRYFQREGTCIGPSEHLH